MPNLRVVIVADEDQIRQALRAYAQVRLWGPEFNAGDEVVFTDFIIPGPEDEPATLQPATSSGSGRRPRPGQAGVIVAAAPAEPWQDAGYSVAFVTADGDIQTWHCAASEIALRASEFAEGEV